ncbi:hypothetical protein EDD63_10277 [Breznakia blatticola]|uniref:Uncharacterized protein n=1 Tax=Breznakia blatticola TaxID=1754012 RepID=A0A4R8A6I0_9FIRM|nr:DUF6120 family protein [Breznakia blatticola]TDW26056.1 hypothetical protein EDD63_10277 [Breznakia blatticola]
MNELKKFKRRIRKQFALPTSKSRDFLHKLNALIDIYGKPNPTITQDDLEKEFGSPKEIYISFLECCSEEELLQATKIKRLSNVMLVVMLVVILVLSLVAITAIVKSYYDSYESIPEKVEIIITED